MFYPALAAAFLCALCNSVATILQKMTASREKQAPSLSLGLLVRLIQNELYFFSIVLDLIGGASELFAVRTLPLFLAQSVIASSVVATALIDRFVLKHRMRSQTYWAVGLVLTGLTLLGAAAQPSPGPSLTVVMTWVVVGGPIVLALAALFLVRIRSSKATIGLALLSGLGFGGTSICGRVLSIPRPYWHVVYTPTAVALAVYALIGILLFTMALQRGSATIINAAMVAAQTLVPTILGLLFLDDRTRTGFVPVLLTGCVLVMGGILRVLFTHKGAA